MSTPRGWYSRGYIPHIDAGDKPQFITWRLADALPASVLDAWVKELAQVGDEERKRELSKRIEVYCDAGHGSCVLRDPRVARIVQETLFEAHGKSLELHRWAVMPNHAHVLVTPTNSSLADTVKKLKGASARQINDLLRRSGRLWQPGFFDRLIRTTDQFEGTGQYIEWNPRKAKLCQDPTLWAWSSANPDAWARLELLVSRRSQTH